LNKEAGPLVEQKVMVPSVPATGDGFTVMVTVADVAAHGAMAAMEYT
jgi:hypothetical protein